MDAKVLIVDDEESIRFSLSEALKDDGYEILVAETGEKAIELVRDAPVDVMLLDIRLPKAGGLEVLDQAKRLRKDDLVVIMVTAVGEAQTAVQAMKKGAFDYINKPFNVEELKLVVRKALETLLLKKEVMVLREQQREEFDANFVIGKNKKMQQIYDIVRKVARSNSTTVLVQGESGTGKELVARALHYSSFRKDKLFIEVNCTAIPEALLESELFGYEKGAFTDAKQQKKGLFELADKGTLFLDEIGDMSYNMQAKLLRALEERSFQRVGGISKINVDIRIIASTNKNLNKLLAEGKFREDLYYRLQVVPITLPPLRERKEDTMILAKHFIDKFNTEFKKKVYKIAPEAERMMLEYDWPGNVRELKNVIERAVLLECDDVLLPEHLLLWDSAKAAKEEDEAIKKGMTLEEMEKTYITNVLKEVNWNKNRAAKVLGIDRTTLYTKIKKYNLSKKV